VETAKKSIDQFDIFNTLTPLETAIITRSAYTRTFKPGECIVREGDIGVGIYLIASGEVKVLKSMKGRQVEIAALSAGSFFGELTLLKEKPRTATVVAIEPTELYCLFRPEFLALLHQNPSICGKFLPAFLTAIMDRIREMYGELRKISSP